MNIFCYYFLIFFIYSFLGWLTETIYCSLKEKKMILNRGFLIGPYIPIYGTVAMLITIFLTEYKNDPFILFCMIVVYASILEYGTSYIMEKIFSTRWWSYDQEKWNLNGRICLKNSLLFGVLGFFVIHFINPNLTNLLEKFPNPILISVSVVGLIIFMSDFLLTIWILSKLKLRVKKIKGDATEEIDREIKKLLAHSKIFYKRLFKAFPKIQFTTAKGDILIGKIQKRLDDMDQFIIEKKQEILSIKKKIKELKENLESKEVIQKYKYKLKEIRRKKFK